MSCHTLFVHHGQNSLERTFTISETTTDSTVERKPAGLFSHEDVQHTQRREMPTQRAPYENLFREPRAEAAH